MIQTNFYLQTGKLRPREGNDQLGVPARHQRSKSSVLGQGGGDHRSSRGSGVLLRETWGGGRLRSWGESGQGGWGTAQRDGASGVWGKERPVESPQLIAHGPFPRSPK